MDVKKAYPYGDESISRVQALSELDYVKGGKLYRGSGAASVLVTSQSDLGKLDNYAPGAVAYTAGFAKIWQLGANGTWVEV